MPRPPGLRIEGARQNNLKNVSLEIPHDRLTVVTGVSGSGKSSLAFDTLFAEGQWRYIESLSTYARMFLDRVDRPDVDRIENIRPAVALEQKNPVRTARSTVGTATEVYDYLRLLYAKIGRVHCPACGAAAVSHSPDSIADALLSEHAGARALVTFPLPVPAGQPPAELWAGLTRRGFARVAASTACSAIWRRRRRSAVEGTIAVVLDRLVLDPAHRGRGWWNRWRARCARAAVRSRSSSSTAGGASSPRRSAAARAAPRSSGRSRCSSRSTIRSAPAAECKGFGNILKYDEALVVPDRTLSLSGGAVEPWTHPSGKLVPARAAEGGQARGPRSDEAVGRARRAGARLRVRGRGQVSRHQRLLRGDRVVPLQAARARLPLPLSQPVALPGVPGARGSSRRPSPCASPD